MDLLPNSFVDPRGTHACEELLSLEYLLLRTPTLSEDDWSPPTTSLSPSRVDTGLVPSRLIVARMYPGVAKETKRVI